MDASSSGLVSSGRRASGGAAEAELVPLTRGTGITGALAVIDGVLATTGTGPGGTRIATTLRAVTSASRSALSPGEEILSAVRTRGDSR